LILLKFEKRDIVLIVGIFLVILGITQYVPFHYSIIIGILVYFGIKLYVGKRTQSIQRDVGEGICMECGSSVSNKKCPVCDSIEE